MKMILARMFTVMVSLTVVGSAYASEQLPEQILVAMASPKTVCGGNTGTACPGDVPVAAPSPQGSRACGFCSRAGIPGDCSACSCSAGVFGGCDACACSACVSCGGDTCSCSTGVSGGCDTYSCSPAPTLSVGPAGYTFCANENQTCSFSGPKNVAYGAKGTFSYLNLTGGTACTNAVFGDAVSGRSKRVTSKPLPQPLQRRPFPRQLQYRLHRRVRHRLRFRLPLPLQRQLLPSAPIVFQWLPRRSLWEPL